MNPTNDVAKRNSGNSSERGRHDEDACTPRDERPVHRVRTPSGSGVASEAIRRPERYGCPGLIGLMMESISERAFAPGQPVHAKPVCPVWSSKGHGILIGGVHMQLVMRLVVVVVPGCTAPLRMRHEIPSTRSTRLYCAQGATRRNPGMYSEVVCGERKPVVGNPPRQSGAQSTESPGA